MLINTAALSTTLTKLHVCVYAVHVKIFHFKKLLRSAGKTGVKEMKLKFSELKEFVQPVQNALSVLPAALKVIFRFSIFSHISETCFFGSWLH